MEEGRGRKIEDAPIRRRRFGRGRVGGSSQTLVKPGFVKVQTRVHGMNRRLILTARRSFLI